MPLKQGSKQSKSNQAATAIGGGNDYAPALDGKKKYDAGEFTEFKEVPIFDEHNDEDLHTDFTPELLQQIVDQCNKRMETGDLTPIYDRHTDEGDAIHLGYASDFRVKDFGKKKAIFADFKLKTEKLDYIKEKGLSRRSVELWKDLVLDPLVLGAEDRPAIDAVAMLGEQRPSRDLGLLKFNKKYHSEVSKYTSGEEQMNPEDTIKRCIEALMSTPEFAYLHELMANPKENFESEEEVSEKEVPNAPEEAVKDGAEEEKLENVKLRYNAEKIKYSKLEAEHKALFSKVAELERKERLATRKGDFTQLLAEGYDFDIVEELNDSADMNDAVFAKHLNKVKKSYRKAPINVNVKVAAPLAATEEIDRLTPEEMYAKHAYQTARLQPKTRK